MRIATNLNEFEEKISEAMRNALNTEMGKQFTKELLKTKLKQNPNMTVEEWKQTKSDFMMLLFTTFVTEYPEAMKELNEHVYNELRA